MPPKTSLGKGFGAMFPDLLMDIDERPTFVMCGIEDLFPNRFQSRKTFDDNEQKQLVSSIKKSGIIQPIIVRKTDGGYEIIAGERRWRAAQKAGLKDVPIIIRDAKDIDVAELSLIENLQREALNPLEEADAYQTLAVRFGLSQEEISSRVGKDRSTIANAIRLLKLPEAAKSALSEKKITAGHARAILSLDAPEEKLKALAVILGRGLSVRETERLVQGILAKRGTGKPTERDPSLSEMEKVLSAIMMTEVRIKKGPRTGKIQITFNTTEELNRLLEFFLDRRAT